jgi:uncharacterized membrane protein YidH (DUF202 family)
MSNQARAHAELAVDPRVDLAVDRTQFAWDRTMLAWLRTTLGLMGAGVAFDKEDQLLHEARLAEGAALIRSGHVVGLLLTATSTMLLMIVCLHYLQNRRTLAAIKGSRPLTLPRPCRLHSV